MFSFFKKKDTSERIHIHTDFHSHLLPGLDDGVESFEESLTIISQLKEMGYNKLITTPHIMHDFYNNSPENIQAKADELKKLLATHQMDIALEAAAEYYLDEKLLELVKDNNKQLLTFGDNFLLFETSFMNRPFYLHEFIFEAKSRGLKPILAHPERYAYLQSDFEQIEDLIMRGVYMQLNINSISGYYSKPVKKMAEQMIDKKVVHFIGSDCHNEKHLEVMKMSRKEKYFLKALKLPLLNNQL
ncbi:MAG: CpsB/CapC family capsule biosynthesis tyrosine phosphatase [Fulvivirga sp.]|nr:CpsB/CapC family capsule biosynthesis tyrosine phosphatase [Fulvivirga sp.]